MLYVVSHRKHDVSNALIQEGISKCLKLVQICAIKIVSQVSKKLHIIEEVLTN